MKNENNKVLAEFLGIQVLKDINGYTGKEYYYYNNFELEDFDALPDYNDDWKELMKVVHRCLQICNEEMLNEWENSFCDKFLSCNIESMYNEVLNFIKWYGTNFN